MRDPCRDAQSYQTETNRIQPDRVQPNRIQQMDER
jgi:hypothetical protein